MNKHLLRSALLCLAVSALACGPAATEIESAPAAAAPTPPWEWTEEEVRAKVNAVRAGRDLTPDSWPGGARAGKTWPKPPSSSSRSRLISQRT